MPLVSLAALLCPARAGGYAVGQFNFVNMETIEAAIEVAEALLAPVIVGVPARLLSTLNLDLLAAMARARAARSPVPVTLHLDHGKDADVVTAALRAGFTSVMFDGSSLPFEENTARTREIVALAHAAGASVEGELGYVGRGIAVDEIDPDSFTRVDEAARFVAGTGVDALAIAYGSVHGIYRGTPRLDLERLEAIAAAVDLPLVLHGGSGLSPEDFGRSIARGIAKVNIYTDLSEAAMASLRAALASGRAGELPVLMGEMKRAVKDVVERYTRLFGTVGRA